MLGKGNSSEVHACQSDSRYVIRTVRQQDEVEWQRELSRLRRVPALSVITTIFATSGRRSLMPRLWPVPRRALRTMEIIGLKYDISAALEMLHRAHIVHADIHADNVMLRTDPACFVLIDYAGCTGDSVYPLHLGYGASGYGGVTHRPPTLGVITGSGPPAAYGDYYRLARTILKQLYIGPEPSKRKQMDKESTLPTHLDKALRTWLERDTWPRPPGPTSPFPPRSWQDSAVSPTITLPRFGRPMERSSMTRRSSHRRPPSSATLVPEGVASEGTQGTGSWERSAISARFFLKCQLKTCGRFARTVYQEIFPWQAYSNQDGYLVPSNPPPPPLHVSDYRYAIRRGLGPPHFTDGATNTRLCLRRPSPGHLGSWPRGAAFRDPGQERSGSPSATSVWCSYRLLGSSAERCPVCGGKPQCGHQLCQGHGAVDASTYSSLSGSAPSGDFRHFAGGVHGALKRCSQRGLHISAGL